MICKKCSKEINNDVKFCPYCGEKNNKHGKLLAIILSVVFVIAIASIIIINVNSNGYDSYDKLLDNIAQAIQNNDIDKLESTFCDGEVQFLDKFISSHTDDLRIDNYNGNPTETYLNLIRKDYGASNESEKIDVSYTFIEENNIGYTKSEEIKKSLEENCNVNYKDIDGIKYIHIKLNGDASTILEEDNVLVAQINDKYYFLPFY